MFHVAVQMISYVYRNKITYFIEIFINHHEFQEPSELYVE